MSQHKKRKPPHHTNTPKQPNNKTYYRVIPVAVIIFILFGIGIAFFAAGYNIIWLIAGAVIGAACGFLFGYQVAKGLSKK
jgi:membrane associated rhomboid family serine protease